MNFSFAIREALSGFKRAKFSTVVSILTISLALILLGIFGIVTKNGAAFVESVRNRVELEAFLDEPLRSADLDSLRSRILRIEGVEKAVYISKEEAARIFKQEFGEDIRRVLDLNPLPPSFKVSLKEGFRTAERAEEIQEELQKLKGVDEVVYRKALMEFIDRRARLFSLLALGLGSLITLSAIFLVSNTIRATISSQEAIFRTMKIVGAPAVTMRLPYLFGGVAQGFLGGLVASSVLYMLSEVILARYAPELREFLATDLSLSAALVALGTLLGFVASLFSTRKLTRQPIWVGRS
jgi:cell division transport system permease protein